MPRPVFLESYQNYLLLEFGMSGGNMGCMGTWELIHIGTGVLCAHRSLILSLQSLHVNQPLGVGQTSTTWLVFLLELSFLQ
jgi:hypothetical protein